MVHVEILQQEFQVEKIVSKTNYWNLRGSRSVSIVIEERRLLTYLLLTVFMRGWEAGNLTSVVEESGLKAFS